MKPSRSGFFTLCIVLGLGIFVTPHPGIADAGSGLETLWESNRTTAIGATDTRPELDRLMGNVREHHSGGMEKAIRRMRSLTQPSSRLRISATTGLGASSADPRPMIHIRFRF